MRCFPFKPGTLLQCKVNNSWYCHGGHILQGGDIVLVVNKGNHNSADRGYEKVVIAVDGLIYKTYGSRSQWLDSFDVIAAADE